MTVPGLCYPWKGAGIACPFRFIDRLFAATAPAGIAAGYCTIATAIITAVAWGRTTATTIVATVVAAVITAVVAAAAKDIATAAWLTTRWEELVNRELKAVKYIARIFGFITACACAVAVTFWHTDIISRHQKLNITFQTHDGELAQSDKQAIAIRIECNVLAAKALANWGRHCADITATAAAIIWFYDFCFQQNRFYRFYNSSWLVEALHLLVIRRILDILGAKNACTAIAAKQDAALVIDRQACQQTWATNSCACFYADAIEETDINCIKPPII